VALAPRADPLPRVPRPPAGICRTSSRHLERESSPEATSPRTGVPTAARALQEAGGHGPFFPSPSGHTTHRALLRFQPRRRAGCVPAAGRRRSAARFSRCPEPGPRRAALTLRTKPRTEPPEVSDAAGVSWRPLCRNRRQARGVRRLLRLEPASELEAAASPAPSAAEPGVRARECKRGVREAGSCRGSGLRRERSGSRPASAAGGDAGA
jgi:hypothetical protein